MNRRIRALWGCVLIAPLAPCTLAQEGRFDPITFERLPASAVRFVTEPAQTPHRHQPETMVSGVALFDYDGDGRLDIYVVNGAPLPDAVKTGEQYANRLYRNLGEGAWKDVTAEAGVAGYGYDNGVATGDYDNDGHPDLFVAGLRRNVLFRNRGDGTFEDVTRRVGLLEPDPDYGTLWGVAAAFFDYDRDGDLDLFVSNYCVWDPRTEPLCGSPGQHDYCHPKHYQGLPNSLFRNDGSKGFTDVSKASGVRGFVGKGMGIGVADFDGDGFTDLFVANDTVANSFLRNRRNGTFEEVAFEVEVACPEGGRPVSGMGADANDIDNDGWPDIFHTALKREMWPLFRNNGKGAFVELTPRSGVAALSLSRSGWGNGIVDLNNDGWKDLFVAAGDVMDRNGPEGEKVPMPNAVFVNLANGRFADAAPTLGAAFNDRRATHRGVAFGDIDDDGRIDAVVTDLHGPLEIWRNVSPALNHWLLVRTIGSRSNRDGMGARLVARTPSGLRFNHVNTAVGFGCASDKRVHFGLGKDSVVERLEITWPSGLSQVLTNVAADQILTVIEPLS